MDKQRIQATQPPMRHILKTLCLNYGAEGLYSLNSDLSDLFLLSGENRLTGFGKRVLLLLRFGEICTFRRKVCLDLWLGAGGADNHR